MQPFLSLALPVASLCLLPFECIFENIEMYFQVFKVHHLQGLTRTSDLYVVVEVDSYGHYFKKSKTKMICNTIEPVWDEEFVIELEGSENLRILVYEQQPDSPVTVLRGRATLELSRCDSILSGIGFNLTNKPYFCPLI